MNHFLVYLVQLLYMPNMGTCLMKASHKLYFQIYATLSKVLGCLSHKNLVEILGLELNGAVLKTMAAYIQVRSY